MHYSLPNVSCYWTLWLFPTLVNFLGQCFSGNLHVLHIIFVTGVLLLGSFQERVR